MIRKRIICCFCFLLLIPMPAFGDSIQTIKETAPGRWFAEIQTEEGNTVTVDTPVHIPNAETVSVLRVSDNCKVSELVGDETFLIGKADVRRREEIYDPNRFSEIGYTPEDLIVFLQGILNANDISDIDLIPYRAEALGSMCYVKSGRVFNRKLWDTSAETIWGFTPIYTTLIRIITVSSSTRFLWIRSCRQTNNCSLLMLSSKY